MLLAPKAFLVGLLRAVTGVKSVILLYLNSLLFAAIVSVPIFHIASEELAWTPGTRAFLQTFDGEFASDFLRNNEETFAAAETTAAVSAVCYLLIYIFLLGGVLTALADRHRPQTFTTFFAACGRHIFPFVRVLVPAAAVLLLLIFLNNLTSAGLTHLFNNTLDHSASANLLGWTLMAKTILFVLLFVLLVVTPVQFARIRCVIEDERGMLRGYLNGLLLSLRSPFTIITFFLLASLVPALILFLQDSLTRDIDWNSPVHPLGSLGLGFNPGISPDLAFLLLTQGCAFLLQAALVMRLAGLIVIYRERSLPPAMQTEQAKNPEPHIVDAPLPRTKASGKQAIPFKEDPQTGGPSDVR